MIDPIVYQRFKPELRAIAFFAGVLLGLVMWALPDLAAWASGAGTVTGACR